MRPASTASLRRIALRAALLLALPLTLTACDLFGGDDRVVYDQCSTPTGAAQTCFSGTETAVGTGGAAVEDAIVDIGYVGYIGTTKFEEGRFSMTLDRRKGTGVPEGIIPGFYFGIVGATDADIRGVALSPMKVGGRRRVVIPSHLAYGKMEKRGQGGVVTIPANSTLTFDLTLHSVTAPGN